MIISVIAKSGWRTAIPDFMRWGAPGAQNTGLILSCFILISVTIRTVTTTRAITARNHRSPTGCLSDSRWRDEIHY